MEFRVPQPVKTITAVSLLAYCALVYQQIDGFDATRPVHPVLDAKPGHTSGTAIIKGDGGYYSRPPEAPIEVKIRATLGAAIPDS